MQISHLNAMQISVCIPSAHHTDDDYAEDQTNARPGFLASLLGKSLHTPTQAWLISLSRVEEN